MSKFREYYTGADVCDNQDDFNVAFNKAFKQNNKDAIKKAKPWICVYIIVWMIFFTWALVLAMQVAPGPNRLVHLVFAMVLSPLYVFAYYLGAMSSEKNASMAMRRFY